MITKGLLPLLVALCLQDGSLRPSRWLLLDDGDLATAFERYLLDPDAPAATEQEWRAHESAVIESNPLLAYCSIEVDETHVRMARLSGAETLFVNGVPFQGDPERRGHRGVPVLLDEGVNHLYVVGARQPVELELWTPPARLVVGTWDLSHESLSRDVSSWYFRDLGFPIFNASLETVAPHVHYGDAIPEGGRRPGVGEFNCNGSLPPLGMYPAEIFLCVDERVESPVGADAARMMLHVYREKRSDVDPCIARIPTGIATNKRTALPNRRLGKLIEGDKALFVYGTKGTDREDAELLAQARYDQMRIHYRSGQRIELLSDDAYLKNIADERFGEWWKKETVILYGNIDTNSAMRSLILTRATVEVERGRLRVRGEVWERDDLSGFFVVHHREDRSRRVGVVASTGIEGMRRGYLHDVYFEPTASNLLFFSGRQLVVGN